MDVTEDGLFVGSSVTLKMLADKLKQLHKSLPSKWAVPGPMIVLVLCCTFSSLHYCT